MYDAVILSDLHLGSDNCQAKRICQFLDRLVTGELRTRRLILNGDVFDSIDFRRLSKNHWKVLSLIRKLSDHLEIIWVCGNHDGDPDVISHLLGVTIMNEYKLATGDRHVMVLHGHAFDKFLDKHPILTWFADVVYWFLQTIDRTHSLARLAKRGSKTFLRCAKKIEEGSIDLARRRGCQAVCCGHTHAACAHTDQPIPYYNSGCWTELPCTYLTVAGGGVELHAFNAEVVAEAEEVSAPLPLVEEAEEAAALQPAV